MFEGPHFKVYKSSAGSGKTYTLVCEYLALALTSTYYFRHILAITFTNKAAGEMKQRILQSLHCLAHADQNSESAAVRSMLPDLVRRTSLESEEICRRASLTLTAILHRYDDFAVRTIDSFTSGIIRTFAHDLHLPVDFEVEMDETKLLSEATNALISRAGTEDGLTELLLGFLESRLDDQKSWHLQRTIASTGKLLFKEGSYAVLDKLGTIKPADVLVANKYFRAELARMKQTFVQVAKAGLQVIADNGLMPESLYQGNNGVAGYWKRMSEGRVEQPKTRVLETYNENKWYSKSASAEIKSCIEAAQPQLQKALHETLDLINHQYKRYVLLQLLLRNLFEVGLLGALETEIDRIKQEQHLVHISEFNKKITELILHEPVPFIYERTGDKFHHFLIDEFQDTSELQWKNLLPLLGNSLSSGYTNLVVGDGKQAIYRFRNGRVEQFASLPSLPDHFEAEVFGETGEALRANFSENFLDANYRSAGQVVKFNNELFDLLTQSGTGLIKQIYHNQRQKIVHGAEKGIVSITFLDEKKGEAKINGNLQRIQLILAEALEDGYQPADIAILTRTKADGKLAASFLAGLGIPVTSAEALLVAASPGVNFVVSLLKGIQQPDDNISLTAAMAFLVRRGGYISQQNLPLIRDIFEFENLLKAQNIPFDVRKVRQLALYDLCEEIVRIFRLDETGQDHYLKFFLDFVIEQARKPGIGLAELLQAYEDNQDKLAVASPEGQNAVNILSIHKAKGLEFPIVIWPMADDSKQLTLDQAWVEMPEYAPHGIAVSLMDVSSRLEEAGLEAIFRNEDELSKLDYLNTMYVACTRAAERLYIITSSAKASQVEHHYAQYLSGFVNSNLESWQQEGNTFWRGTRAKKQSTRTVESHPPTTTPSIPSQSWHGRIRIAGQKHAPTSPSRQMIGSLVHDALSAIQYSHDFKELVLETNPMDEHSQLMLYVSQQVSKVLGHPRLKPYFSVEWCVKAECGILLPDGRSYRPDRVVFRGNEAVVIEFKTGQAMPEHEQQIDTYGRLLGEMGYRQVQKILVYIDDKVTVTERN